MMDHSLSMGPRMEQRVEQRQSLSLEQRLALKLKQELQLKMSLKQVLELVQKLWPALRLSQRTEQYLSRVLKNDTYLRRELPSYLSRDPTALELQQKFPQLAPIFNDYYRNRPDYGSQLRAGHVVAPSARQRREQGCSLGLGLKQKCTLKLEQKVSMVLPTNWSFVDAWDVEKDSGCLLPKRTLDNFDSLPLERRLERVDQANEVFRFDYLESRGKYFKVPLLRNRSVLPEERSVPISKQEYEDATEILKKAGRIQRIVRAVPYSELNRKINDYLEDKDLELDDVVIVGVDRGGRLPAVIISSALGKEKTSFLKVDQSSEEIDGKKLKTFIDEGTLRGKYVLFVDSTVDSGRQIRALRKYFDDEEIKADLGIKGWIVTGSNENGQTLEDHLNIDWGLDPDQSFEDNPELMGVDYAPGSNTAVVEQPTDLSKTVVEALLEVPRGVVLDVSSIVKPKMVSSPTLSVLGDRVKEIPSPREVAEEFNKQVEEEKRREELEKKKKELKKKRDAQKPLLLIIGDGQNQTLDADSVRELALSIEQSFRVIVGTDQGNPGCLLKLVSDYEGAAGVTLLQPSYVQPQNPVDSVASDANFEVFYEGRTKDEFRDGLVKRADLVLALGGNDGTWTEIQKSLSRQKPTIVIRGMGSAGQNAEGLSGNPHLYLAKDLDEAISKVVSYTLKNINREF